LLILGYRTGKQGEKKYLTQGHSKSVGIRTLELLAGSLLCSFIVCTTFCQGMLTDFPLVSETNWDFNKIKVDPSL